MRSARMILLALTLSACGTLDTVVQPSFMDDIQALREMCATLGPIQLVPVAPDD